MKKLGAAICVVGVLGAISAGGASAAATTTAAKWYTYPGGQLTGSQSITAEQIGFGAFETTLSGMALKVQMSGVECIGCVISNSPGGYGEGKLRFTGVFVTSPSTCSTTATIESKVLKLEADYMEGESAMVKVVPAFGETSGFTTFTLSGASCPIAGNVTPKGRLFGKDENKTAVLQASQRVSFSNSINSWAGGSFRVGEELAVLTSTIAFRAGGTLFGVT